MSRARTRSSRQSGRRPSRRRSAARRPRNNRGSSGRGGLAVLVALTVVLVLVGGAALAGMSFLRDLVAPAPDYQGTGRGRAVVQVEPGETLSEVGITLHSGGVVKSVDAFLDEADSNADATSLQPGYYALRRQMSSKSALALLLEPSSRVERAVTIPEGSRLSEIVDRIVSGGKLDRAKVVDALGSGQSIDLPTYANGHPEGFLFPATYVVDPGTTAPSLARQMVHRFTQAADSVQLQARARKLGITPTEAVVVASLVEGEARHQEDFGKVARVVYNRLHAGMRLQLDSTVNYALDADKTTVTLQDLQAESPYNTYRVHGLPPGPISSPGEAALEAALNPPKGDWRYFVTVDRAGTTKFTSRYQEFLEFKRELKENRG